MVVTLLNGACYPTISGCGIFWENTALDIECRFLALVISGKNTGILRVPFPIEITRNTE